MTTLLKWIARTALRALLFWEAAEVVCDVFDTYESRRKLARHLQGLE